MRVLWTDERSNSHSFFRLAAFAGFQCAPTHECSIALHSIPSRVHMNAEINMASPSQGGASAPATPTQGPTPNISKSTELDPTQTGHGGHDNNGIAHPEENKPTDTKSEPIENNKGPAIPSLASRLSVFASLSVAVFLSSLDVAMVSILVPTLADEFDSVDKVGWYGSV